MHSLPLLQAVLLQGELGPLCQPILSLTLQNVLDLLCDLQLGLPLANVLRNGRHLDHHRCAFFLQLC